MSVIKVITINLYQKNKIKFDDILDLQILLKQEALKIMNDNNSRKE